MNKYISIAIVSFILVWMLWVGVLILHQAFTSPSANAQLIAHFFYPDFATSSSQFTHLTAATSISISRLPLAPSPPENNLSPATLANTPPTGTAENQKMEVFEAALIHLQMTLAATTSSNDNSTK